jgi:NAD+ synthase
MSKTLSVDFVQANPRVGDIEGNLALVFRHLDATSADLLVFPECFLTGYPLQDLVLRPGFLAKVDHALDRIAARVREKGGAGVLVGAPVSGTDLPYNAAHLLSPDGTRQVALKVELPNSDVFDERRTFARGHDPKPLVFGDWKLGVMVCEDMWHGPVSRSLRDENAEVFIVINGSPMETGKQAVRLEHAGNRVRTNAIPLVYLNLIGGQDELVFDGASFVLDAAGECLVEVPFTEAVIPVTFSREGRDPAGVRVGDVLCINNESLTLDYPDRLESVYRTLVLGVHDYVRKNGFQQILLGLSGGVDSALVAAIAVDALGPDALLAVMMPATWTGEESKSLASEMAERLGCRYLTEPVGNVVDEVESVLTHALSSSLIGHPPTPAARALASENIQARSRGNLLMALSNALPGALVLSTGNKSEMSVGYATLYGDMCGGMNPLPEPPL